MSDTRRLNVSLDLERSAKLASLAERVHVQEGTLARSLLSQAIDDADPNPLHMAALLDGIPGALARAEQGQREAKSGETIPLDDF